MKTIKLLYLLIFATFTHLVAMRHGPPCPYEAVGLPGAQLPQHIIEQEKRIAENIEKERKEALQRKRIHEARTIKPLTKITGNALITRLLTDSDSEKTVKLNQQPLEIRENLINLIENKKSLLDENEPAEKEQVKSLDELQIFIRQNINAAFANIQELQEQKKIRD